MNRCRIHLFLTTCLIYVCGCKVDESQIDTEKPIIDLSMIDAFPKSCDTLYFGEQFNLKAILKDNSELGTYSIGIHHNFDQHTHSTEFDICSFDNVKPAVNPCTYIQDYTIPANTTSYDISQTITIPKGDGSLLHDPGDYHFEIRLTDKEGWSALKGLNIKILHR